VTTDWGRTPRPPRDAPRWRHRGRPRPCRRASGRWPASRERRATSARRPPTYAGSAPPRADPCQCPRETDAASADRSARSRRHPARACRRHQLPAERPAPAVRRPARRGPAPRGVAATLDQRGARRSRWLERAARRGARGARPSRASPASTGGPAPLGSRFARRLLRRASCAPNEATDLSAECENRSSNEHDRIASLSPAVSQVNKAASLCTAVKRPSPCLGLGGDATTRGQPSTPVVLETKSASADASGSTCWLSFT
jgi:hypothetical protein